MNPTDPFTPADGLIYALVMALIVAVPFLAVVAWVSFFRSRRRRKKPRDWMPCEAWLVLSMLGLLWLGAAATGRL